MTKKLHDTLTVRMSDHLLGSGVTDLKRLRILTFKEVWLAHGPADAGKQTCPRQEDFFSLLRALGESNLKLQDFDPATQLAAMVDRSFLKENEAALGTRTHNALARVGLHSELCYRLLTIDDIVVGTRNFGPRMSDRLTTVLRKRGIIE